MALGADPYPAPPPVRIPRDLQQYFGDSRHAIFCARVVEAVTRKGRHQRRIILLTADKLFLCETEGTVRRVYQVDNFKEATVDGAGGVLLQTRSPEEEPSLLFVDGEDPRNRGQPRALDALRALWAHRRRQQLPVTQAPSGAPLLQLGRFNKGHGYQSPRRQLMRLAPPLSGEVVSPTPTDSDVSQRDDSPVRPGSPVARGGEGGGFAQAEQRAAAAAASAQLDALRAQMQAQEQQLRQLNTVNSELRAGAAAGGSAGGALGSSGDSRMADLQREVQELRRQLDAAGIGARQQQGRGGGQPRGADELQREIEALQQRHRDAEIGEHARRQAAMQDDLLRSPGRQRGLGIPEQGSGGPRFVVLTGDQAESVSPQRGADQGSPRFVAVPSPRHRQQCSAAVPAAGAAGGDAFSQLLAAQERNRQLEERNRQLEQQLRGAAEAADALRARDRELRREQRRQERRRRESEAEAQMEDTKEQIRQVLSRVEDFERRNWEMAQAIQSAGTPSPQRAMRGGGVAADFLAQWPPPDGRLTTPAPPAVRLPDPELRGSLAMLLDLRSRGAPGLDAAIAQLQGQLASPAG
eukprot:TRINITY_DN46971_c0_g1_i1.p1 TRINITY_DN46971_c0_g1~~TRINITY_DN46971_c0_g1_i1.p1  ORF type:complete len:600 (+),score=184.53 TRINITY_DN46971_c0_g1_i1:63-1802(+)